MKGFAWLLVGVGLFTVVGSVQSVRETNLARQALVQEELASKAGGYYRVMEYDRPVTWLVAGLVVAGLGLLLLAIRRPEPTKS